MKFLSLIFTFSLFVGCGSTKEAAILPADAQDVEQMAEEVQTKPERNVKIKATIGEFTQSDLFDIKSVKIEGNLMFIDISFSGGCAEHSFKMIGNAAIKKSLPPIRSIQLVHENNDDVCRSIVNKTIEVDITDLGYSRGEIMLQLDGWKGNISYKSK